MSTILPRYANTLTAATTRYTTWFGLYTDSRHSIVQSHYNHINNNTYSTYKFDCTCTDAGTYAYVYPDTFGTVYLCPVFWLVPTTGTDSQVNYLPSLLL